MSDEKDVKIKELEETIIGLKKMLKEANDTIYMLRMREYKRKRHDMDYLPYEEDDRR